MTFDDGLRSVLEVAPTVAHFGVPASLFLVANRAGGVSAWPGQPAALAAQPTLTWRDARGLARLGFRFGAHGATHRALDGLPPPDLEAELQPEVRCL